MSATLILEKSKILERSKIFENSICGIGSTAGCFLRQLERVCKQVVPRSNIGERLTARTCNNISVWSFVRSDGTVWCGGWGRSGKGSIQVLGVAIPLIARPTAGVCLLNDGAGLLEPAHRSARAMRRQHTTAAHFGTVAFPPPKSVGVSSSRVEFRRIAADRAGLDTVAGSTRLRLQLSTTQGRLALSPTSLSFSLPIHLPSKKSHAAREQNLRNFNHTLTVL